MKIDEFMKKKFGIRKRLSFVKNNFRVDTINLSICIQGFHYSRIDNEICCSLRHKRRKGEDNEDEHNDEEVIRK